jgi:hypothetical protein
MGTKPRTKRALLYAFSFRGEKEKTLNNLVGRSIIETVAGRNCLPAVHHDSPRKLRITWSNP